MPLPERRDHSDDTEIVQLKWVANNVFGLEFSDGHEFNSAFNILAIRSEHVIFSQRIDSRTYFIQNDRFGIGREAGVYKGNDEIQFGVCRAILDALAIARSEISREVVLREKTQVAEIDQITKTARMEDVQEGRNVVRISRHINEIPVWSSHLSLGLTAEKQIGFMQLHWPEVPTVVEMEA
jgi:hypothetical protein